LDEKTTKFYENLPKPLMTIQNPAMHYNHNSKIGGKNNEIV
jgi:hypothetical protein